jgi:hypothetical protein
VAPPDPALPLASQVPPAVAAGGIAQLALSLARDAVGAATGPYLVPDGGRLARHEAVSVVPEPVAGAHPCMAVESRGSRG